MHMQCGPRIAGDEARLSAQYGPRMAGDEARLRA